MSMRPDEHPRLQTMGSSEATCMTCITELFVGLPDEACDGCALNPITDETSKLSFLNTALQKALSQSPEDLQAEVAFDELVNRKGSQ